MTWLQQGVHSTPRCSEACPDLSLHPCFKMCAQFLKHEKKQMMMERIKWNFEKVRATWCSMVMVLSASIMANAARLSYPIKRSLYAPA